MKTYRDGLVRPPVHRIYELIGSQILTVIGPTRDFRPGI